MLVFEEVRNKHIAVVARISVRAPNPLAMPKKIWNMYGVRQSICKYSKRKKKETCYEKILPVCKQAMPVNIHRGNATYQGLKIMIPIEKLVDLPIPPAVGRSSEEVNQAVSNKRTQCIPNVKIAHKTC